MGIEVTVVPVVIGEVGGGLKKAIRHVLSILPKDLFTKICTKIYTKL